MKRSGDGYWMCTTCDYQSKKSNVQQHVETKHVSVQYSCHLCNSVHPTKNSLSKHMSYKHKYWNKFVASLSLDINSCIDGYMSRNEDSLWQCNECYYQSRNKDHVRHHVESKHVSVQYNCQYCDNACPTKYALNMHIRRHHKK